MVTHSKNYAIIKLRKKLKKNNSVHIHKTVKKTTKVIINPDSERGSLHPGKAFCQIHFY